MSFDIQLPNISAQTEKGKIEQIRSYLHQLAEQLKWALNTIETGSNANVFQQGGQSRENGSQVGTVSTGKGAEATFNSIKSLIISSAEIVEAYYEAFNERFDGEYLAISDFGTYKEETSQQINSNSTGINQLFTNHQEITVDIGDMYNRQQNTNAAIGDINAKQVETDTAISGINAKQEETDTAIGDIKTEQKQMSDNLKSVITKVSDVNAHIKAGFLYYDGDGVPIYGLEIGQVNKIDGVEVFNKYARFTSERLSFYDKNDIEVAYISDYKLYITNAQITGTLTLGRFEFDTSNGIAVKWV